MPSDGDDQPITTEARHLSVDEAKAIALRFFAENGALKGATDTDQISGIELAFAEPTSSTALRAASSDAQTDAQSSLPAYYVFNINKGFVVVSAWDVTFPI